MASLSVTIFLNILKFWVIIYEFITFPFYLFYKDKSESEIGTSGMPVKANDPSSAWRNVKVLDGLYTTPVPGCDTLVSMWERACRLWPTNEALGTREIVSSEWETQLNGRQFKKLTLGNYSWETFEEVDERINNVAKGLIKIGLIPGRDKIVIFAETRAEWMIVAQACFKCNVVITTLYATLGEDAIVHAINESEAVLIFTSDELLEKIVPARDRCPSIKNIIFMDNKIFKDKNAGETLDLKTKMQSKLPSDILLMELSKLEELGDEDENDDILNNIVNKPTKDSLAIIMYTSGSTGVPKGVEISQGNIVASMAGMKAVLPPYNIDDDIYISYLPLAHVMELVCEFLLLTTGIRLGYSSPLTLTDTSSKIKAKTLGDISVLRPTLMVCVPTILERISKAVWDKAYDQGPFFLELFKWAYDYKRKRIGCGYPSVFMDKIVFRRIKKLLGGRIRFMLSGGAPLSEEAQNFVNICFCPIVQGYGLTETCAGGSIMSFGDLRTGHAGPPICSVEIRLRQWAEGGYFPTDMPHPRGEILIGGPNVAAGYYKQPEKTAEDFTVDGNGVRWFCTGDIGTFTDDGCLRIIDRKKDLVKLQTGEYISLGKVELAISTAAFVETVCVYADSLESFAVCFISPKQKQLIQLSEKRGIECSNDDLATLCTNEKIIDAVTDEVKRTCIEKKVERFEIPTKVYLDPRSWTPDTGMVTDALKLKRKDIKDQFVDVIDDNDIQSLVLEIMGTNVSTTFLSCPNEPERYLGIKLPFLVMIVKNLKKYFTFEVQILDDKNIKRRFRASNYQSTTRVQPFVCTMPMRLDEGWNQIQFNLSDFTRRAYGTNYVETLRIQIHANCRIRRVYFSDRLYSEDELPAEFKLYLPIQNKSGDDHLAVEREIKRNGY